MMAFLEPSSWFGKDVGCGCVCYDCLCVTSEGATLSALLCATCLVAGL